MILARLAALVVTIVAVVACGSLEIGDNALIEAAGMRDEALAKRLLAEGEDPNADDNINTPLTAAVDQDAANDIVELLLTYGADPDLQAPYGYTPLTEAVRSNAILNVRSLLDAGASLTVTNRAGVLPCQIARSKQNLRMELLVC